jgi:RND family efflux transporter MFP subunit
MKSFRIMTLVIVSLFVLTISPSQAQNKALQKQQPAAVVTQKAVSGEVVPATRFVGTVFFNEEALVATEVNGIVKSYHFTTGQRVTKGQPLVRLDTSLLREDLESSQALMQQSATNLQDARKDYNRKKSLFKSGSISEQEHDKAMFFMRALEKKVLSQKNTVDKMQLEIDKAVIRAPFSGVVIERRVNRGEWLSRGDAVASVARTDIMDVRINVPESVYLAVEEKQTFPVQVAGKNLKGKVYAKVAKGDVATRTFPFLMSVRNPGVLADGMEAEVELPSGPKVQAVLVPRDAVINAFGTLSVFAAVNGKAVMFPVKIVGYQDNSIGVTATGLTPGMNVVTKGNERLQPGQPVTPTN